jgi:uncharacterized membrane protein YeaQ/YmgE (transglycosylase-associated protein family)
MIIMSFNIIGSLIAAVVSMALGMLWYSDALFGVKWRADMGFSDEMMAAEKSKGMTKQIVFGFIGEFVTAMILSYFLYALGASSLGSALAVAFWAWLGFCATLQFGAVLWARSSYRLFWINTIHRLVSFLLIVVVLVLV